MKPRTLALLIGGKLAAVGVIVAGVFFAMRAPENPGEASTPPGESFRGVPGGAAGVGAGEGLDAARAWVERDEPAKAVAILEALSLGRPDDQEVWLALGSAYLEAGGEGSTERAYEAYVAALSVGPRTPEIEFQAGTLANTIGRRDLAVEHYSMAQTLRPDDPEPALYLGVVLQQMGRLDEAKASLLRAAVLAPDDPTPFGSLAQIALDENKPELALDHVAKAVAIEPTSLPYRLVQARAFNRLGRPEEAIEALDVLSTLDRQSPAVWRTKAQAYGLIGDAPGALAMYADAVEIRPADADVLLEAATWAERAGDIGRARAWAKRAGMLGNEVGRQMAERLGP